MPSLEDRVQALEDERSILNTMYTYGHSLDYGYEDQFLDCWTEDAFLDWGGAQLRGHEELRGGFRLHTHAPDFYHKHFMAEPRIVINGDTATVDSMFARLDAFDEGPGILAYGRYLDKLVRCEDGKWRFVDRRAETECLGTAPAKIAGAVDALATLYDD